MIKTWALFKEYHNADIKVNFTNGVTWKTKIFNKKYKLLFLLRLDSYLLNKSNMNKSTYNAFIHRFIHIINSHYQHKFSIEISSSMKLGKKLYLPHPNGIIIHPKTIIGDNCRILQQVTIGNNISKGKDNLPVIGNNVTIGAGAKIIGPCKIGNNVVIGANSVVVKDIPDNYIVAGVPAKIIRVNT